VYGRRVESWSHAGEPLAGRFGTFARRVARLPDEDVHAMTTLIGSSTTVVVAPRALTVAVKAQGVVLPRFGNEPEVALDLAALILLHRLCSAAGVAADDVPANQQPLLDALESRGMLLTGPRPARSAGGEIAAGSDRPNLPELTDALDVVLPTPMLLMAEEDGFGYMDHTGQSRLWWQPLELVAVETLTAPTTLAEASAAHRQTLGSDALDESSFRSFAHRLWEAGLLVPFDPNHPVHARQTRQAETMRDGMRRQAQVHAEFDRLEQEHDANGAGTDRIKVVGVHYSWSGLPASLAMILAAAKAYDGGRLTRELDIRPRLLWDKGRLEEVARSGRGIYLFSNYIWSSEHNLGQSALVKQVGPHNINVHGGPNTPKYLGDVERYFAQHPHVDVAVHGEGEATFTEMLDVLSDGDPDGPPDLSVLEGVAGLSYRVPGGVVQTAPRDRIEDLDSIPSPILTGLYEGFTPAGPPGAVIIETNRGCPYGCTFCDWGSATLSRVRKFDLERIFGELEWCAQHNFGTVGIADANFGIFERDVEIAQKIADLKAAYGYPKFVGNNYAKNTVKHLSKIIEIFTEAGIVAEGKMSMQTFDQGTLTTIRRKNIKVEKYYDLSGEFRRNDLPMMVDIMMGLPGSTPDTFRNDLQECLSRAVRVAIHTTLLLTNSPMNEPEYRLENGITALPGEELTETSSYTRAEWEQMMRLMNAYYVFENFGVLRQIATYVHAETGSREIDFYERLVEDVHREPDRWPSLRLALNVLPELMVPPVSWRLFVDEVRDYLVSVLGMVDDDALETVLAVQHALLPARGRTFPFEVELPHDYAAWFAAVAEARDRGMHHDWHQVVDPLRQMGSAAFTVDDPFDVCTTALGGSLRSLMVENAWDLDSPVSRPRQRVADAT
jgi:radical SAM superfamily enzyme YgiQ (UPF0313 family)